VAQSGNGIDLGAVYALLTEMSARMDTMSARLDSHDRKLDQLLDIVNNHTRTLADHTRRFDDVDATVANLRSDVRLYHDAVIGQGVQYGELEDRVRRVERHLKLESGE
jgi:hypothetical protein